MGITLSQSEEKKAGSRKGRPNYDPVLRERLAAAACEPGVSVAKLAREHGINANMLFAWRRRLPRRLKSHPCNDGSTDSTDVLIRILSETRTQFGCNGHIREQVLSSLIVVFARTSNTLSLDSQHHANPREEY